MFHLGCRWGERSTRTDQTMRMFSPNFVRWRGTSNRPLSLDRKRRVDLVEAGLRRQPSTEVPGRTKTSKHWQANAACMSYLYINSLLL